MSGILGGPSVVRFPTDAVLVFAGAAASDTYDFDIRGASSVRVILGGSALVDCLVKIEGRIAGSSALREIPAVGADTSNHGQVFDNLTTYGLYDIDATGLDRVRFTIETLTSGTLNMRAAASALPATKPRQITVTGEVDANVVGTVPVTGEVDANIVGTVPVTGEVDATIVGTVPVTGEVDATIVGPVSVDGTVDVALTNAAEVSFPATDETVFDGASASDTYDFDLSGHSCLRVHVSGTSIAGLSIKMEGRLAGSSVYREVAAVGSGATNHGQVFSRLTATGYYDIAVSGLNRVRFTVETLSAGTLNARAVASALPPVMPTAAVVSGAVTVSGNVGLTGPAEISFPATDVVVFSSAAANDTYDLTIAGQSTVRVLVAGSGLTDASIKMEGRLSGSSAYREIAAVRSDSISRGRVYTRLTTYGYYDISVTGMDRVRFTVETLTSGTLNMRAVTSQLPPMPASEMAVTGAVDATIVGGTVDVSGSTVAIDGPVTVDGTIDVEFPDLVTVTGEVEATIPGTVTVDGAVNATVVSPVAVSLPSTGTEVFTGASASDSYTFTLSGQSSVRVHVTGTALVDCSVKIEGRITGASALRELALVGSGASNHGQVFTRISALGYYDVDVTGLDRIIFTVETLTSGTLNIRAVSSQFPAVKPTAMTVSGSFDVGAYVNAGAVIFAGAAVNDIYDFPLAGQSLLRVQLSGSGLSDVSVKMEGRLVDSSAYREVAAVGSGVSNHGQLFTRLSDLGLYDIDVSGFNRVRFTVETLAAGTLNLRGVASSLPAVRTTGVSVTNDSLPVSFLPPPVLQTTAFDNAKASDVATIDMDGYISALINVSSSGDVSPFRITVTGRRIGGASSTRRDLILRPLNGSEAGVPVHEITEVGYYVVDCTGLRQLQFTVAQLTGTGDLSVGVTLTTIPHVPPTPVTRHFTVESANSSVFNTREAKTLRAQVFALVDGPIGFRVEGRPRGTSTWQAVPAIGPGRILVPWRVNQPGVWEWDVRAIDEIRIVRNSSDNYYYAKFTIDYDDPVQPVSSVDYGLKRFVRFVPEDGVVEGQFFAIKALTDCTLGSAIRFFPNFAGETSGDRNAGIEDTDPLLAGDILYGPFDRVEVNSGIALAYLL